MGDQVADLKTIQNKGLQMLLAVDRLCNKYDLSYFLDSGTLLGAVRHGGFIPWDDDVDLAMPRDDYERFLDLAKHNLPGHYFVQTNDSDASFPFGFAKIVDLKSKMPNCKDSFKLGFCIDVLPIDNAHDNKWIHKFNVFLIRAVQGLSKSKIKLDLSRYKGAAAKTAVTIAALAGKPFSTRTLMRMQKRIATASNNKDTKYRSIYSYSYGYLDRLFPSRAFGRTEKMLFEGHMLPVPAGWDEVLTIIYGDYMKSPPPEDRVPSHGFNRIQFFD